MVFSICGPPSGCHPAQAAGASDNMPPRSGGGVGPPYVCLRSLLMPAEEEFVQIQRQCLDPIQLAYEVIRA
jgi:hypothetical protein